ncbi:PucR family transcriptional regulator ligand-binding domain-containing protein [Fusibacter bizertensis]|uniref:PucR family transcriptional regulator ligand-binding domain-containing protein n=1 Tax=Fusibacter bizertensis TaxID=1488331 RepID=A0ABT6NBM1_9FIRM|nr:PucR family transcriptional regulator [Fusibacter bizertensis]MDH8677821.1 PucR family transcriptional regulator ligand-binding domain-containing protein [Fusibacter bizertensis]
MYVTIDHILHLEKIEGIKLIAGASGIQNRISNVNMLDNPDTFDWLISGDLLLTTGYIFKNDVAYQKHLIQELYERNCAGLGMKVQRYFEKVPEMMISAANELGFPIIEIPYRYSLSDISNVVTSSIYGNMDSILKKSLSLHETFTKVALRGGTLNDITATIAEKIRNPLILLDSKFRLLAYKDIIENQVKLESIFDLHYKSVVFDNEFNNKLPVDPEKFKKSIKIKFIQNELSLICRVIPVIAIGTIYGYLVVVENVSKLTEIDYIALEHGATVIALERIKAKEIEVVKHRVRSDFFDDLLSDNIRSVNSLNNMAEIHGLNAYKKHYCMISELNNTQKTNNDDFWKDNIQLSKIRDQVTKVIHAVLNLHKHKAISIHRRNKIITFVQIDEQDTKLVKNQSLEIARDIVEKCQKQFGAVDMHIGIGKVYEILSMSKSFKEAQEAINMEFRLQDAAKVAHYENYMIYNLLGAELSKEKLKEFYDKTVGNLVDYDKENNTNLVESLKTYFAHNGNISEASKEMFIHRNTFIYRIEKIKSILASDLKDSEALLELQLGLKIMDYLLLGNMPN